MRFYLDENLSPEIARMLRRRRIDAVSAHEVGRTRLDDFAALNHATRESRFLVTADVKDFPRIALEATRLNTEHAGIILVPSSYRRDEFTAIVAAIQEMAARYPKGLPGQVVYLSRRPTI